MEALTRLPGGTAIVFCLAIVIALTAFAARRWEVRRLAPPTERTASPAPA